MIAFESIDESRLAQVATKFASGLCSGGSVHLAGPLGAGKTSFARAVLRALGAGERVKSPTYTLIETYALPGLVVHHLDLYRIAAADELEWLGLRDLDGDAVLWLVEWPERGAQAIPQADCRVELAHAGETRDLRLSALTPRGAQWLKQLQVPTQ